MSEMNNTLHTAGGLAAHLAILRLLWTATADGPPGAACPAPPATRRGAETFRRIATYCKNIGVKYLTVYAFSTENWKRSETEVSAIMALLKKYLLEAVDTMERDHIRLHFFGDMTPIDPELQALAHETDEITEHLSKDDFQANVCLNYGGRDEILRAVRRFAAECAAGERKPEELNESLFSAYLDSAGIPAGADYPAQRGTAAEQFSAVAVRLFRVLLHRRPLAGL